MDELTRYVIRYYPGLYYPGLMTPTEAAASATLFWARRADASSSPERQRFIQERLISSDQEVLRLLANGAEQFYSDVAQRIL